MAKDGGKVKFGDLIAPRYSYGVKSGWGFDINTYTDRQYGSALVATPEGRDPEGIPMPLRAGAGRLVRSYIDAVALRQCGFRFTGNSLDYFDVRWADWFAYWPLDEDIATNRRFALYGDSLLDVGSVSGRLWNGKERKTSSSNILFEIAGSGPGSQEVDAARASLAQAEADIKEYEAGVIAAAKTSAQAELDELEKAYESVKEEYGSQKDAREAEWQTGLAEAKALINLAETDLAEADDAEALEDAERRLLEGYAKLYWARASYATDLNGERRDGQLARVETQYVRNRLKVHRTYAEQVAEAQGKSAEMRRTAKEKFYGSLEKSVADQTQRHRERLEEKCEGHFLPEGWSCLAASKRRNRISESVPIAIGGEAKAVFPVSKQAVSKDDVMAMFADMESTQMYIAKSGTDLGEATNDSKVTVTDKGERSEKIADKEGNTHYELRPYENTSEREGSAATLRYSRIQWKDKDGSGEDRERYEEHDEYADVGEVAIVCGNPVTSSGTESLIRRIVGDFLVETRISQGAATADEDKQITILRHARLEFEFDRKTKDGQEGGYLGKVKQKYDDARKANYSDAVDRYKAYAGGAEAGLINREKAIDMELDKLAVEMDDRLAKFEDAQNAARMAAIDGLVESCNRSIADGEDIKKAFAKLDYEVDKVNSETEENIRKERDDISAEKSEREGDALDRRLKIREDVNEASDKVDAEHSEAREKNREDLLKELKKLDAPKESATFWERWKVDVTGLVNGAMVRPAPIRNENGYGSVEVNVRLTGPFNVTFEVDWPYLMGDRFEDERQEYVDIAKEEYRKKTGISADGDEDEDGG